MTATRGFRHCSRLLHDAFTLVILFSLILGGASAARADETPPPPPGSEGLGGAKAVGPAADVKAGSLKYFNRWDLKGGYVAAGTAMRNLGKGTIKIYGIPANSTVQAAYLFWNIISPTDTPQNKHGLIDGQALTGTLVATTSSPCWGGGYSRTYRANVKSFVKNTNASYLLTGFASGITNGTDPWSTGGVIAPMIEGASLVIVYAQPRYPYTRILLYNGAVMTHSSVGYAETSMSPVPFYLRFLAYTTFIVADGQSNASKFGGYINAQRLWQADFNGTDPRYGGGQYAYGNLWDTERPSASDTAKRGIPVGKYIEPGYPAKVRVYGNTDCLVHVAQVLSLSNGDEDTDHDGLLDNWEQSGYRTVDLPTLGANPFHKDLFLEMDWMQDTATGDSHRPSDAVLAALKKAFSRANNIVNPDQAGGISLHIKRSNRIAHTRYLSTQTGCGDLFTKLEAIKTDNMPADRYRTHHYQLWVHELCSDYAQVQRGTSGIAQAIPGDDSIVSLGDWTGQGTEAQRIGTSMHEFGHTLNLRHGYPTGAEAATGGDANDPWSPNHLSIMSYLYQFQGLYYNGAVGLWDFQRWNLPALNESCLNENSGVGTLDALDHYGLRWITMSGTNPVGHDILTEGVANGPVDWDADGETETCESHSINNDGDLETLKATAAEWRLIVYNGGAVGAGSEYGLAANGQMIPVYYVEPGNFPEMTYEQYLALNGQ